MALKTNLNSAPYYDDFDSSDNFHRVLFRPGYAIQARELTQIQSILQDQIEKHGNHIFKDGAIVIPGQVTFSNQYQSVRLNSTFNGESIDPAQYNNPDTFVTLTGETSGVTAEVIGYAAAGDATTQPLLYVKYISSGTSESAAFDDENSSIFFENGENLSADITTTHTTTYSAGSNSLTVFQPDDPTDDACAYGSAVRVNTGVFYVKGTFVELSAPQTLVLSYNDPFPSARVGFTITEEVVTPEADTSLLDNATGTSNYAAKGAHRLKINLTLSKKTLEDSSNDDDFVELIKINQGEVVTKAKETQYSILGNALAQRTYEESGDYTVKPYQLNITESVDNFVGSDLFQGAYEAGERTDDFTLAQDDFLTLHIQPGISYVNGFRQENVGAVRKDLLKARDVKTIENSKVDFEIGNYVRVTNVYNSPDIGDISDETTPYRPIILFDGAQSTRGSQPSANPIGVLRPRAFQHESSGDAAGASSSNTTSIYRLYSYDVRAFVELIMSDTPNRTGSSAFFTTGGVQVTGVTSGATGFVFNDTTSFPDNTFTSGATIFLTNVIGEFEAGEKIKASDDTNADLIVQNSGGTDLTITTSTIRKLSDARSLQMQETDSGQDFIADIVLENLDPADNSFFADSTTSDEGVVKIQLEEGIDGGTDNLQLETLKGARFRDPEQQQSIFKMPKDVVKTLLTEDNNSVSQTELTFRKQFIGTTSSAGVVSFQAQANETFVDFAESDYTLSILTAGGGTGSQGDIVSISGNTAGHNTATLTITDNTVLGSSAKVKVIATIKKTNVTQSTKTTNLSKQLKVIATDADGAYGTRATDIDISLGRTDVYRIQAIYDSEDTSTDAVTPTLTVSDITGTFERGERIKGNTSGARGRLVTTSSPLSFTQTFGEGSTQFEEGETVTGEFSGATAVIDTDGITTGSRIITDNFKFDDGQRNNYYDISRLTRKKGIQAPTGRLLIIYDYLSHGSGFFFSVDSYSSVSGQMEYDDIPTFIPTTADPDDPAPASEFPLADCLDFRPTVENIAGTSETLTTVDQVTGNSFDFFSRQYDGTGAIVTDTLKPNSTIVSDFEFYLPKIICLYLTEDGQFQAVESEPNEQPTYPAPLDNAMKLADFILPAYTFNPDEVDITYVDNSRYTMRDIGKLEQRIDNLEYYTALTLLENQTKNLEVLDTNGLSRFKSGFVVDAFTGHNVGDQNNSDYNVSVDADKREMRPPTVEKSADLKLLLANTTEQTAAGFQKTNNLVTLPYTVQTVLNNAYTIVDDTEDDGTTGVVPDLVYRSEDFELNPDEDSWFETQTTTLATRYDTRAYDNKKKGNLANSNSYTIYGSWKDSGQPYGKQSTGGSPSGMINRKKSGSKYDRWLYQYRYYQREARTDTVKTLSYDWTYSTSTKQIGNPEIIKYCRPKAIKFVGTGFKPNTRHYVFFDGKNVDKFSGPLEKQYAVQTGTIRTWEEPNFSDVDEGDKETITPARPGPNMGIPIKSNAKGKMRGFFLIPDHRGKNKQDVPKFPTGELILTATANKKNEKALSFSFGEDTYIASGKKTRYEKQTVGTKNPKIITKSVSQTRNTKRVLKYQFGGKHFGNMRPSSEWQYYSAAKTDQWVRNNIQSYINQGILQVSGNYIRVSPAYQTLSPGVYTREVSAQMGLIQTTEEALHQSFYVDKEQGYFASRLVIYFTTKAKSDSVTISIVTTEAGIPTEVQLPYSRVSLGPDEVNADTFGKTATIVDFPAPVYLKGGEKYAIRIKSAGDQYRVKVGTESLGETKHPALSEMFFPSDKVEEGGVSDKHMRFNINCAVFNLTDAGGKVTLRNAFVGELMTKENGGFTYGKRLVRPNPLEFTNSITKVKVNHSDHGMYSTSNNVEISGVKSGVTTTLNGAITSTATKLVLKSFAGFSSGSTHAGSGTIRVKIDNELFAGTLSGSTLTVSGRGIVGYGTTSGKSVAHSDGATVELYMLFGVPLNQINKIHTSIADIEMDSYTIAISTGPTVTGSVSTISAGGTDVFASENYRYELFKTYVPNLELPNTALSAKVRQTTGTSPGGSETSFTTDTDAKAFPIALNDEYPLEKTALIASPPNETNEMDSNRSFFLDLTLSSNDRFLSPVIDMTNTSVICIGNRIDNIDSASDVYTPSGATSNYRASTDPEGDNNTAIYLTKPVQLENTATGIKLFLDVNKSATSEVKALFRILPSEGEDDIKNLPFTFFNTTGVPDSGVATNAQDIDDFVEYKYTAGINDFGAGVELQDFQQFQIKLVLQGTNSASVPRLMNLRAIALAT